MVYPCDFYLYYEQIEKGGRLINCQECGKLVLIKSKNDGSTIYCTKCRKEKELEKKRAYWERTH